MVKQSLGDHDGSQIQEMQDSSQHHQTPNLKLLLLGLSQNLADEEQLQTIWDDDYREEVGASTPMNFSLHLDTANHHLEMMSDQLDAKDRPLLEFDLNGDTGHTVQTKRAQDGSFVYIKEKDINMNNMVFQQQPIQDQQKSSPQMQQALEQFGEHQTTVGNNDSMALGSFADHAKDLEIQRDNALQIVIVCHLIIFAVLTATYFLNKFQPDKDQILMSSSKGLNSAQFEEEENSSDLDLDTPNAYLGDQYPLNILSSSIPYIPTLLPSSPLFTGSFSGPKKPSQKVPYQQQNMVAKKAKYSSKDQSIMDMSSIHTNLSTEEV